MVNNSSDRYYKKTKKDYKNRLTKGIKIFRKKKKKLQYGRERYINLTEHKKAG